MHFVAIQERDQGLWAALVFFFKCYKSQSRAYLIGCVRPAVQQQEALVSLYVIYLSQDIIVMFDELMGLGQDFTGNHLSGRARPTGRATTLG